MDKEHIHGPVAGGHVGDLFSARYLDPFVRDRRGLATDLF
jgi:hypothetical protein